MTSYSEQLQDPVIAHQIESRLSGYIAQSYTRAGMQPPIPVLNNGVFIYADTRANKIIKHMRNAVHLHAALLDDLEKNESEGD
ncbi:hypothetical protein [Acinetobacter sp. SA01]|uniref:hypothetical protein n=1 Tax=Acinetobacter sp. SA01 TaxID=1862567 RepID=UPI001407748E|nr:hypothetical protein [Acinetobacter sp. SA01]